MPVEAGYAASMLEVAREWSLADVYLVARRVAERDKARKEAIRRAKENR